MARSVDIDLKCSGKFRLEFPRNIPLCTGIDAITFVKYMVSILETPHVRPRQESRPVSISSDRRKPAAKASASSKPSSLPSADSTNSPPPAPLTNSCARQLGSPSASWCSQNTRAMCTMAPTPTSSRSAPALIFERLWRETGCQEVVRKLLVTRHHHFDVERAVFMTVLHRLMVSGSDRSALQWRRDHAIDGTEALDLQHLYRAMGWLGETLGEREPDAPSPRRVQRPHRGGAVRSTPRSLQRARPGVLRHHLIVLHRQRRQYPRPVRQEQKPPQRLQTSADMSSARSWRWCCATSSFVAWTTLA